MYNPIMYPEREMEIFGEQSSILPQCCSMTSVCEHTGIAPSIREKWKQTFKSEVELYC